VKAGPPEDGGLTTIETSRHVNVDSPGIDVLPVVGVNDHAIQ